MEACWSPNLLGRMQTQQFQNLLKTVLSKQLLWLLQARASNFDSTVLQ